MHICTLNFLEIQEEFLNISLGCKFRFKILAKSYKRKDNVTLGLGLRMKTKRVILSMFLVKTSFVMKTLYLHLTSHFDLIPFNGSANASELTVFFFVKNVI